MAFRYSDLETREVKVTCDHDGCGNEPVREFHDEGLTGESFCRPHFRQLQRSRLRAAVMDEFRSSSQLKKLAMWRSREVMLAYGR